MYEAWIDAARHRVRPFTPAALGDTGRVNAVVLLYMPETPPGPATAEGAVHDTTFSVELHFGPGISPIVGVVDPRHGVRRVAPGESLASRVEYDRVFGRRRRHNPPG